MLACILQARSLKTWKLRGTLTCWRWRGRRLPLMPLSRRMQILMLTCKATESATPSCSRKTFSLPFRHPLYTPPWRLLGRSAHHPLTQVHWPSKGQSRLATQIWCRHRLTSHCLRRQQNPLTSHRPSRSKPPLMRKGCWNHPRVRHRSTRHSIKASHQHGHSRATSPSNGCMGTLPTSSTCGLKTLSHWRQVSLFRRLRSLSSLKGNMCAPTHGPAWVLSPPIWTSIQGRQYCSRGSKTKYYLVWGVSSMLP